VRESTVCMRENDMYVSTVLRFRDRRYELKKLTKDAKSDIKSAKDAVQRKDAEDRALVYDSLQVAHKVSGSRSLFGFNNLFIAAC